MRFIFGLFIFISFVFGAKLEWMHDLDEAKKYAKMSRKPVILFLHSRNCFYCPKLREEVFPNSKLQKYLKENFILLSLDTSTDADNIEEDVNDQAPERFITSMTPAFVFFGPDEEMLSKKGKKHMIIYGFWTPEQLIEWGEDALRKFNKLYGSKYEK